MAKRKAFTLIELLVVIAIIALLIGILSPALAQVKRYGRTIKCRSNLRQYAIAGRLYMGDNDELFPSPHRCIVREYDSPQYAPDGCQWHMAGIPFDGLLCHYLTARQIHLCPTFKTLAKSKGRNHFMHKPSIPINPQYSYSMNAYLGDGPYSAAPRESHVMGASRVFFFAEENPWPMPGMSTAGINNTHLLVRNPPYRFRDYSDRFATYHNVSTAKLNQGVGNVVWLDGHAEGVKAKDQRYHGTFRAAWPKKITPQMLQ